jgi:phosphomannomutase
MRAKHSGAAGVMITASHNEWMDNGVKIIERNGNMLEKDWESVAEMIVNSPELTDTI